MKAWRSGRVVDYRSIGCWILPSLCYLVFSGHYVLNVKLRNLEYFTLYLRNRQSGNLRAIESCVCSVCSIERNMMSFLRRVWKYDVRMNLFLKISGVYFLSYWRRNSKTKNDTIKKLQNYSSTVSSILWIFTINTRDRLLSVR
jgi:hypothetical protein